MGSHESRLSYSTSLTASTSSAGSSVTASPTRGAGGGSSSAASPSPPTSSGSTPTEERSGRTVRAGAAVTASSRPNLPPPSAAAARSSSSSSAAAVAAAALAGGPSGGSRITSSLQGEVIRQTRTLQRLAGLTYEEFLGFIKELNEISSHFLDSNGKQLVFAVKKGTDSTVLWKATVRVACVKIDAATKDIESHQALNLRQFLQVYNGLKNQSLAISSIGESAAASAPTEEEAKARLKNFSLGISDLGVALASAAAHAHDSGDGGGKADPASASAAASGTSEAACVLTEECVICLERKPGTYAIRVRLTGVFCAITAASAPRPSLPR